MIQNGQVKIVPTCIYCKTQIAEGSKFCSVCGKDQKKNPSGFVIFLLVVIGLGVLGKVAIPNHQSSEARNIPSSSTSGAEPGSQPIPTDSHFKEMTTHEHLAEAKRLLALSAPTGDDLLWAEKNATAAKEQDPKSHEALAVEKKASNELAKSVTSALLRKVDQSDEAIITSYLLCKQAVEHGLKAPSTAKFQGHSWENAWHWRNHPGGVIANITVDAQNSFGAYLRSTYECNVLCLTPESCSVAKVYEVERK